MNQGALTKKDRLWIELAVRRVDWALDGRVPKAKRSQIQSELRSNLIEAASEVGARRAVEQLGDLRALAASYLELYRGRFDFRAASWAAFISYLAVQALGIAIFIAFHAGVAASGGHQGTYSFEFWSGFGPFAGSVSADGRHFVMVLASPAHVVLILAAFLAGGSYRHLLARR